MKLLYLWIEDYKNIKQQGFNFSGEYKFDFESKTNEKGEFTGGKLTCKENNDYIPDFFGENIDVTAIVGKNGSGKSSILKVIFYLIYKKYLEYNPYASNKDYDGKIKFGKLEEVKAFLLFSDSNGYYIFDNNNNFKIKKITSKNNSPLEISEYNKKDSYDKSKKIIDFYSLYFNYMFDTLRDNENETWINKVFHKLDGYKTPLLMEPHKIDNSGKEIVDISLLKYITTQRFLRTIVNGKENKFIDNFFNPNKVVLKLNKGKISQKMSLKFEDHIYKTIITYDKQHSYGNKNKEFLKYWHPLQTVIIWNNFKINTLNNIYIAYKILSLNNLKQEEFYKNIKNKLYYHENETYTPHNSLKELFNELSDYIDSNIDNIITTTNNNNNKYSIKYTNKIPKHQIYKLNQAINFKKNILDNNLTYEDFIKIFNDNDREYIIENSHIKNNKILLNLPPWIDVEFYENKNNLKDKIKLEINKDKSNIPHILASYLKKILKSNNIEVKQIKQINKLISYDLFSSNGIGKLPFNNNIDDFIDNIKEINEYSEGEIATLNNVTVSNQKKDFNKIKILDKLLNENNKSNIIKNMFNQYIEISEEIKNILKNLPSWIKININYAGKSFSSLSSGEKTFFNFMMNLIYQLDNLSDIDNYNSINLFLDETELGFHPDWQTRYLNKIIEVLKGYNKKINLIITTHSPFILSDIPKSNVIFLDKDENGNCKVVDGIDKSNTFGANIHTLLADSFFMENGTMGEFAKEKINEVIEFLNLKLDNKPENLKLNISQEEVKYIISIIGEPFLKEKLEEMYFRAFGDDKSARKEALLRKKKEIEEELEELEND